MNVDQQNTRHDSDRWPILKGIWESVIRDACLNIAENSIINPRDLQTVVLLHLPRFSSGEINQKVIVAETERLFRLLLSLRSDYRDWIRPQKIPALLKDDLTLQICEDRTAQLVYERFHYIGSSREGLVHLGLFHRSMPEIPMALVTVAAMDVPHFESLFGVEMDHVALVARSYAFDWAPRNSISFLTGRLRNWLKCRMPGIRSLVTYVNPNLGFSGVSYAASGWHKVGEKTVKYRYLRGQYLSYRKAIALTATDANEIVFSSLSLAPLLILTTDIPKGYGAAHHGC